jgi:membrane-associated phospholipid phosphatase
MMQSVDPKQSAGDLGPAMRRFGGACRRDFNLAATHFGGYWGRNFGLAAQRLGGAGDRFGGSWRRDFGHAARRVGATCQRNFGIAAQRFGETGRPNFGLAARRFGGTWGPGVPAAAWRIFARSWPYWLGGAVLALLAAFLLDGPSVAWARELPRPVRQVFNVVTDFGKSGWLLVPTGLFAIFLLFGNWRQVDRRIAAAWTEFGILIGFIFISVATSGIITNIIKQFIGRGRPRLFAGEGAYALDPFPFAYSYESFPSGHATTAGALAVIIAVIAPRYRYAAFFACGLIALSRVAVGAHYPSDIVAGFMLGSAFTWFYALALAAAGIGFAVTPSGTIKARAVAIRGVFGRPRGLSRALSGLWSAFAGRSPTVSV